MASSDHFSTRDRKAIPDISLEQRDLPPLNALKAFEAAARLGGFQQAAEELCLTRGAVGQQVKRLEKWLEKPLFERHPRGVTLTMEGTDFAYKLTRIFDQLDQVARDYRPNRQAERLLLATTNSFASRWLLPRLADFKNKNPKLEVHLLANNNLQDMQTSRADLAIRYGRGQWPGLTSQLLSQTFLEAVCSPDYEGRHDLKHPEDLFNSRLLRLSYDLWPQWFAKQGLTKPEEENTARPAAVFSDANLMLQAAEAGQGVALGQSLLIKDALQQGKLIPIFSQAVESELAYYLVAPEENFQQPKAVAFIDWLTSTLDAAKPN